MPTANLNVFSRPNESIQAQLSKISNISTSLEVLFSSGFTDRKSILKILESLNSAIEEAQISSISSGIK